VWVTYLFNSERYSVLVPNTLVLITKTDISTGGVLFYFKLSCIFHICISLKKRLIWYILNGAQPDDNNPVKQIMHQFLSFTRVQKNTFTIILKTVMYMYILVIIAAGS